MPSLEEAQKRVALGDLDILVEQFGKLRCVTGGFHYVKMVVSQKFGTPKTYGLLF